MENILIVMSRSSKPIWLSSLFGPTKILRDKLYSGVGSNQSQRKP